MVLRSAGHRHPPGPPQPCKARSGRGLIGRAETRILRIRASTGTSRENSQHCSPRRRREARTLLPRDGLGTSGNGQRYFPQPFPSSQHQGESSPLRCIAGYPLLQPRPGALAAGPWGATPACLGGAASPCLGHLLASSTEISTSMPVTPSKQTLRWLPGLGA